MDITLSESTLACCRCAILSHLKDLRNMHYSASTIEFRTLIEDEDVLYNSALEELNYYFKNYHYE